MTHDMGTQVTESLIVHVNALLEDLIPEYLEQQKEDVKCMIAACGTYSYFVLPSADRFSGGIAVHNWHLNVHKHQVVVAGDKLADGDLPVLGDVYSMRSGFHVQMNQLPICRSVLHQQDV